MTVLVTGATGFIGQALVARLLDAGYGVIAVGRSIEKIRTRFGHRVIVKSWAQLEEHLPEHITQVVHLAGAPLDQQRWSPAYKKTLSDSRLQSATDLIRWLSYATHPIRIFLVSGIGIYGALPPSQYPFPMARESMPITHGNATDLLAEIGQSLEQLPHSFVDHQMHLSFSFLRLAPVIAPHGGLLKTYATAAKWGVAPVMGSGLQMMSWIHLEDVVRVILHLIARPSIIGPINLCAPFPVRQRDFAKEIGKAYGAIRIPIPGWLLKLAIGQEMTETLLLKGQAAYPERLIETGFDFDYPQLGAWLRARLTV